MHLARGRASEVLVDRTNSGIPERLDGRFGHDDRYSASAIASASVRVEIDTSPRCSPSSAPPSSTTSTRRPGSPTFSAASPGRHRAGSTNSCPGTGKRQPAARPGRVDRDSPVRRFITRITPPPNSDRNTTRSSADAYLAEEVATDFRMRRAEAGTDRLRTFSARNASRARQWLNTFACEPRPIGKR